MGSQKQRERVESDLIAAVCGELRAEVQEVLNGGCSDDLQMLGDCVFKSPLPAQWKKQDDDYVNRSNGDRSQNHPLFPIFARLGTLVCAARRNPSLAPSMASCIVRARDDALLEAEQIYEGWTGPLREGPVDIYVETSTGVRSAILPAAAPLYVAYVAQQLLKTSTALPAESVQKAATLEQAVQSVRMQRKTDLATRQPTLRRTLRNWAEETQNLEFIQQPRQQQSGQKRAHPPQPPEAPLASPSAKHHDRLQQARQEEKQLQLPPVGSSQGANSLDSPSGSARSGYVKASFAQPVNRHHLEIARSASEAAVGSRLRPIKLPSSSSTSKLTPLDFPGRKQLHPLEHSSSPKLPRLAVGEEERHKSKQVLQLQELGPKSRRVRAKRRAEVPNTPLSQLSPVAYRSPGKESAPLPPIAPPPRNRMVAT